MSDELTSRHTDAVGKTTAGNALDTAVHGSALAGAVVISLVLGRPAAWIGFGLVLAPVAVAFVAVAWLGRRPVGSTSAIVFAAAAGWLVAGGWVITQLPDLWRPFALAYPLGVLMTLLGVVNFVLVSMSRTVRAARRLPVDYPWIVGRLARGIDPDWTGDSDGNR